MDLYPTQPPLGKRMRASPDGEAVANVGFPDGLAHQAGEDLIFNGMEITKTSR